MEEPKIESMPPTKVGKTWFIQRGQNPDDIFACQEAEAWDLFHNRSNWMRSDFKIVGVSDGSTYVKMIREAGNFKEGLEKQVGEVSREVTKYSHAYDKFKYEELLEDTDPKVMKLKGILAELNTKLDDLNKQLQDIQKVVINNAFKAELEVARGHIEHPSNQDFFTPGGNREKILKNFGQ
jgi:hypothetical protein